MSKRPSLPIMVLALLAGLYLAYRWYAGARQDLTASGVLEARNINVGSKIGGRVLEVRAREGDHVEPGQVLMVFDDAEWAARLEQARGKLELARANLAKMERGSRPEDIAESRAAADKSGNRLGFRREESASAQADLARAKADADNAGREFHRMENLLASGAVSKQNFDDARARSVMAQAQVASLEHNAAAAEGRLRAAEAAMQRTVNGFRPEDVQAARAEVMAAEGQLHEAEALWREHEVKAPAAATVEVLDLRPGHLLPPNAVVAKLLEDDQLYVMVYVPEPRIGRVKLGQKVEVRVDSHPDQTFAATVEQIRQQAEFLPRNVQTLEERAHQVIGVKLRIDNADHQLRAGIHADVSFLPEGR
jgi:ABC exporter DevB family membrane fusion protein